MTSGPYGSQGTPAEANPPVCPRHTDRISYVRCQRCERPTCPECQRPAAVGILCVSCVAEQAAHSREAKTVFGAQVRQGRPIVTLSIIAITLAVFLLQFIPGIDITDRLLYAPALTLVEPWRLLTVSLVHSTGFILHVGLNMYGLWLFGQYLEPALGRWRFLILYLVSAIGGSVGVMALADPNVAGSWYQPVVGASGAIFGLFGAMFVIQRRLGGPVRQILVLIAINAVIGFVVPGIAWQAHLGGLITGALAAAVLAYAPRKNRTAFQIGGIAAVFLLLGAAIAAKTALVPVTAPLILGL
ncbi:rhomboid family intramembrane serine protease [Saxibacter everestensis]|uniref:Rhomboid family intramembrane serine protease n=1 Tax=Saxibacter everestensis TaxID=2909229 RepID=A0ABY8QRY9_9MICO|nr:rhomboid family intramembrane serine protease [Brevibacteriaceae bacterium ZFBP1038]